MRRLALLWTFIALSFSLPVHAGPVFDDYLNYVRPGVGTGPGPARAICVTGHPIGQTFTLPLKTGEIYRIGIRPAYETWSTGERVTMTLFDSPRRKVTLGQYDIDQVTSHVQAAHQEGGKDVDRILYFQFRSPTGGKPTFFFEISVTGGDGAVAFQAFNTDRLAVAQAFPEKGPIKDLSFECHIKPLADRDANLRTFFADRLDLSRPDLSAVKTSVNAKEWDRAIAETVKHFHGRKEVWGRWKEYILNPRVQADTRLPDLLMHNMVLHEETNQPVVWRPESYWAPEYPTERKQEAKTISPSPYTWHFDRALGRAYFDTKKEEYARKAVDLRMQFILDNPNPRISGVPWLFELWNDRTAAARAPGFGTWAYAFFYDYPGFTDDQKLVFYSFLEDNARWIYKSTSGANWGAEAARACYEFGVLFPEWKLSKAYVDWGTHRLAEIVLEDVRGDGTSTEAAIKYHAMVARRLKSMLEDHFKGSIKLEPGLLDKLIKSTEKMYEVMAYTLQPNSIDVMCGDSWNENYAYSGEVKREDLIDASKLLRRLKDARDPLSAWLKTQFQEDVRKQIDSYDGAAEPAHNLISALLGGLSKITNPPRDPKTDARPDPIYAPERFVGITLSPITARLLEVKPLSIELEHLNRLLISDAYPDCIAPAWKSGELQSAAEITKRPDFTWFASQGRAGRPPMPVSRVFPDGGYFIMRSDFGPPIPTSRPVIPPSQGGTKGGRNGEDDSAKSRLAAVSPTYLDSRQLLIHNGGWFGSHGHADLLSINLYGYGRTLLIDPGQYDYKPPEGIGQYWSSNVHSMLVLDGKDTGRNPGPSEWTSNSLVDYFDGQHHGYKNVAVRRRVAFIKPDYFLVDDSVAPAREGDWAQVWNLTDSQSRIDETTKVIQTTFPTGGNLQILSQHPSLLTTEIAAGIRDVAGSKNHAPTRIVRLHQKTSNPRFSTLLVPYDGPTPPSVRWNSEDGKRARTFTIETSRGKDWLGLGQAGEKASFGDPARGSFDADFAAVLADGSYCWSDGSELNYERPLARAAQRVHSLAVRPSPGLLQVEVSEPEATLAIALTRSSDTSETSGDARPPLRIVLNGKPVTNPVIRDSMYYPFADQPQTIVADDRDRFEAVTKTGEWTRTADPRSWQAGYTQQETDPGRHETGRFTLAVPQRGKYALEVFVPATSVRASDRVEYHIPVRGTAAPVKSPIVAVRGSANGPVITVNQQAAGGWVRLGEFDVPVGDLVVTLVNVTPTDGLYLIADAMRLVKSR